MGIRTKDLIQGKTYHRPSQTSYYYYVVGWGMKDDVVVQSFWKANNNKADTFTVAILDDWEDYDTTPEVSNFYNVYFPEGTFLSPAYTTLTGAKEGTSAYHTSLGVMEVVHKGDKRVRTVWYGDV